MQSKAHLSKAVCALALFAALAAPSVAQADWPAFLGGPLHINVTEKAPLPPLKLAWRFDTNGPVYSSAAIKDNKVYIGSYDKSLYCLDAATGAKLWSFATQGEILSSPAVDAQRVYFGSKDGFVYALNATTGELAWKFKTDSAVVNSPALGDGIVFIGSLDLYLYALDAATGKRLWRAQTMDYEKYSGIYSSPAYSNASVVFAGKNGFIYSTAKSGGRNFFVRSRTAIYSSPVIKDDVIYLATFDRVLYALNEKDGKQKWKRALDDTPYASPVVAGDSIYMALQNGSLRVFNVADGKDKARFKLPAGINSTPLVMTDGFIYVGCDDGGLYTVDPELGTVRRQFGANGGIHSSPAMADAQNLIIFGSKDGSVYALGK